jgi:uncharacterized protein YdhG (YjbR/CyaY superfamily)
VRLGDTIGTLSWELENVEHAAATSARSPDWTPTGIERKPFRKANVVDTEVQRYMDAVPEERQARFHKLHTLIMDLYPDAEVVMSYRIPTYKAKSGWVGLANQKDYVSVYTNGPQHIAAFKAQHPEIKTGKACINFKDTDAVPIDALKQVVRHAIEDPK